jgi:benzoyl-CoA reductase/2-hydroxyglutaryl-CoA dehydratase subunit BcrC/BadD/HgdB
MVEKSGLEALKYYYANRFAYAQEWKAQGKKVVGYLCNCVPEEMIIAAGFLPYRISGDPTKPILPGAKKGMRPKDENLASMLSMLFGGDYSFLDYLIVPRSKSNIDAIYGVLNMEKKKNPESPIPELYNYKRTQTTFTTALEYDWKSIMRLKAKLEEWAGKEITDEALKDAIAVCNETRALLKQLEAKRTEEALPISGTDALQMIAPAMFIEKREYNKLLKEALDNLPDNSGAGKVRAFVGGGPKDNIQLYELIESCGTTIVGEDHCWGNRYSDDLVDETITDPMYAIFKRYIYLKGCPYVFPIQSRIDYCANSAKKAKADIAVFYCLENDTQAWDVPEEKKAVEALGIKAIYFAKQPYTIKDPEAIKAAVSKLVADYQQGR